MATKRYDYNALKLEFFQSDFDEISVFFKSVYSKWTGTIAKATTGWAKDKNNWMKKVTERAITNAEKRAAKSLEIPLTTLKLGKKNAVGILMQSLNGLVDKKGNVTEDVNIQDVCRVLDKIKTELKEPTNITRQFNTEIRDDSLTEEEQELIEKIEEDEKKKKKKKK